MRRLTTLVLALALAASTAALGYSRANGPQQFTDAEIAAATIIVTRESAYTVGVSGDGTVTYIGSQGMATTGTLTHKLPVDSVRELVNDFLRADFFRFADSYRDIYYGGLTRTSQTHTGATTITVSLGKRSKSVYATFGVPIEIKELARRVEEVTDVRRYTGKAPQSTSGPHILSGRVTDGNGRALDGATITLAGGTFYEARSDGDGRYEIPRILAGNYTLIATAPGFVNAVAKRKLEPDGEVADWSPVLTHHEGALALWKLRSKLNLATGGTTQDCGEFLLAGENTTVESAALERALECAANAMKNRVPFRIIVEQRGFKTWAAHGVAGGPDAFLFIYSFIDSFCIGPICAQLPTQMCYSAMVTLDDKGKFTCGAPLK